MDWHCDFKLCTPSYYPPVQLEKKFCDLQFFFFFSEKVENGFPNIRLTNYIGVFWVAFFTPMG